MDLIESKRMDWIQKNGLDPKEWIGSKRMDWIQKNGLDPKEWIESDKYFLKFNAYTNDDNVPKNNFKC
jgi:hypothetical protein